MLTTQERANIIEDAVAVALQTFNEVALTEILERLTALEDKVATKSAPRKKTSG